jgi:hypothetical protein
MSAAQWTATLFEFLAASGSMVLTTGSRNKFGEQFVADFYEDWQQHGAAAIVKLREESVRDYLRVAVAILPKELHVKTESIEDLSDNELMDILDTIRALTSEDRRTSRKRD